MNEDNKSPIQLEDIVEANVKEVMPDAYIIKENIAKCAMCGTEEDLRMGWCFPCAEAQSILGTGLDMYEKGSGGSEFPTKEVNQRLKMLIEKGWVYKPSLTP